MNGVLIINKPKGITSNAVVQKIRKVANTRQVGHCGTLDPLATGVLPILIGKATKISKYLVEHDKTYIATIKLGEKTETADSEGEISQVKPVPKLDGQRIKEALYEFLGIQMQTPPIYSAIKKDGKKLYEYAREGVEIEIEPRKIEVYSIKLLDYCQEKEEITYEVSCSKGTYIRSLCENIAEKLGTVGYMKELVRTRVNNFTIENSITVEELEMQNINDKLISIEKTFEENKKIELNNRKYELFLNGVMLTFDLENGLYRIYHDNKFIGLGVVENELLKRDVIAF